MNKIELGRTGLKVHQLGFGGIPIQRVEEDQAVEVVRHAVKCGVDFIDTSRVYTTSENRIGKALQKTDKKVILATKSFQRTADGILGDIDVSLKELQTDYIDIYQCHAVMNETDYANVIAPDGALAGLRKAQEKGLIGHIGLTSHSLDLLEKVVDDGFFDTIMVCFSFMEPAARERVIPAAKEKNIGVIAMKPFSGGVIEKPEIALKWVLAQPEVLILGGVEQTDLFDQNWQTFADCQPLTPKDREIIAEIRKTYDKAFCRRCDYCQPCSEEIPIQFVLGAQSIIKRSGGQAAKGPLISWAMAKAKECTACGECMTRCPYDLPIPDLIKEKSDWFEQNFAS
jgi:uncharacterized protein